MAGALEVEAAAMRALGGAFTAAGMRRSYAEAVGAIAAATKAASSLQDVVDLHSLEADLAILSRACATASAIGAPGCARLVLNRHEWAWFVCVLPLSHRERGMRCHPTLSTCLDPCHAAIALIPSCLEPAMPPTHPHPLHPLLP